MKFVSLFSVLTLFFFTHIYSQTLYFDKAGVLKGSPPAFVKEGDSIRICVEADLQADSLQRVEFVKKLEYLYEVVGKPALPTTVENPLRLRIAGIYRYMLNNLVSIKDCDDWKAYVATGCFDVAEVKTLFPGESFNSPTPVSCKSCICAAVKDSIKVLDDTKKRLNDIVQNQFLIRGLACDWNAGKLSSDIAGLRAILDSKPVNDSIRTVYRPSFMGTSTPAVIRFGNVYYINQQKLKLEKIDGKYYYMGRAAVGKTDKPNKIDLVGIDQFNVTVLNWHNEVVGQFDSTFLKLISRRIQAIRPALASKLPLLANCKTCDAAATADLNAMNNALISLDSAWLTCTPVGEWLSDWLWYSGGDHKLNYFNFTDPANLRSKHPANEEDTRMAELKEYKAKAEEFKKCLKCDVVQLDSFTLLQNRVRKLNKEIDSIASLKSLRDANSLQYKKFTTTQTILHRLTLKPSQGNSRNYTIYHDAMEDFNRPSEKEITLPEDRKIFFGIYNSEAADTSETLTIQQTFSSFNDSAKFTQDLLRSVNALSAGFDLLSPLTKNASAVVAQFLSSSNQLLKGRTSAEAAAAPNCVDLRDAVIRRYWRMNLLDSLVARYLRQKTPDKLQPVKSATGNLNTFFVKAKISALPFTNEYAILAAGKEKFRDKYNIGRTRYVSVAAGLFFTANGVRQTEVDTAGGSFKISNTEDRAKFAIGAKLYPFQSFDADNKLIPRFPAKRISIFAGFELQKPLDNLYLGLGYDIVPGLNVSAGAHFYKANYYTIQNAQIINKSASYKVSGLYYGVSIDPIVLAGIIKLLIK